MTDHNLICEEPYFIGLFGAISFVSFSIGSIIFSRFVDIFGRKPALLLSSAVTPLGLLAGLVLGSSVHVIFIQLFVLGLLYSTRSSTAYIVAIEFLSSPQARLNFAQAMFIAKGLIQIVSGAFFYWFKDQHLYFWILTVVLSLAIGWMAYAPETPSFLV